MSLNGEVDEGDDIRLNAAAPLGLNDRVPDARPHHRIFALLSAKLRWHPLVFSAGPRSDRRSTTIVICPAIVK